MNGRRVATGIDRHLLLGLGLRLLGTGVATGLTGATLGTRYIEVQLFGVTATDPLTFVGGCVVLAIAGLTVSVIPALRASASTVSARFASRECLSHPPAPAAPRRIYA